MNNMDSQIDRYEGLELKSKQQSESMREILVQLSPQFLTTHGSEIIKYCTQLRTLSIQSRTVLEQIRMKYAYDSDKFTKIIGGAERRLDRQLDDLSMMRRMLITMPVSTSDPNLIAQQKRILDAISMAQESFNREISLLYDL